MAVGNSKTSSTTSIDYQKLVDQGFGLANTYISSRYGNTSKEVKAVATTPQYTPQVVALPAAPQSAAGQTLAASNQTQMVLLGVVAIVVVVILLK